MLHDVYSNNCLMMVSSRWKCYVSTSLEQYLGCHVARRMLAYLFDDGKWGSYVVFVVNWSGRGLLLLRARRGSFVGSDARLDVMSGVGLYTLSRLFVHVLVFVRGMMVRGLCFDF